MQIEQARALKAALEAGIAKAEQAGASEIDLAGELDAALAGALAQAQQALAAGPAGGAPQQTP